MIYRYCVYSTVHWRTKSKTPAVFGKYPIVLRGCIWTLWKERGKKRGIERKTGSLGRSVKRPTIAGGMLGC